MDGIRAPSTGGAFHFERGCGALGAICAGIIPQVLCCLLLSNEKRPNSSNMPITRNRFLHAAFLLVSLAAALYLGRQLFTGDDFHPEPLADNVDLTLKNIQYTKASDGVAQWKLAADVADQSIDSLLLARNMRVTIFDKTQGDITVAGRQGHFDTEAGKVQLTTDVRIVTPSGWTLQTDLLDFDEKSHLLTTNHPVILTDERCKITGQGAIIDLRKRTLEVTGKVHALMYGSGGEQAVQVPAGPSADDTKH